MMISRFILLVLTPFILLLLLCADVAVVNCQGGSDNFLVKGLVYYPPYTDPFAVGDENLCQPLHEWPVLLPENTFTSPKLNAKFKDCRGSLNNLAFVAPHRIISRHHDATTEQVEDFVIDTSSSSSSSSSSAQQLLPLLQFTCRHGRVGAGGVNNNVKSGLYFWVYTYRSSGIVKAFTIQTTMAWDSQGKLLFQPTESRTTANVSCRYYDPTQGYFVAVRTWRISFSKTTTTTITPTSTVRVVLDCSNNATSTPALFNQEQMTAVSVVATSYWLDFYAFCPITLATCTGGDNHQQLPQPSTTTSTFLPLLKYSPESPYCRSNPNDPASYPSCMVDPRLVKEIAYTCSSPALNAAAATSVKIVIQSGARFSNDEDFKAVYLKEDDRDVELPCSVQLDSAPDVVLKWEFLPASLPNGQYSQVVSSLYKQVSDLEQGRHKLVIRAVKPEHEGSYRCVVQQSSRLVPGGGGQPIYGYYFVKVYAKPWCTIYDAKSNKQLTVNNNVATVQLELLLMATSHITLRCSLATVSHCPALNGGRNQQDICQPVAMLFKDGSLCSTSNSTYSNCSRGQRISTSWIKSEGLLAMDIITAKAGENNNNNESVDSADYYVGSYSVQLAYAAPVNIRLDVPLTINVVAPPSPKPAVVETPKQALPWIMQKFFHLFRKLVDAPLNG